MGLSFLAALLMQAAQPPAQIGPPVPPPPRPRANQEAPGEDEIVVTGERYDENSPYRVPMPFRNQRSDDDAHASWDTRVRDLEALERFGGQTIGLAGPSQGQRQLECQWRAARQEMRGERPDCGAGLPF